VSRYELVARIAALPRAVTLTRPHYLVADIARTITLLLGDVLLSGTPANSRSVQPGDVAEVEVEGLGRLTNHIVEGPHPGPAGVGA
jgi:5-oxopent-3-ene-1,2,5-tricarboxylate decarboxylase/2-hydroxyhepta-2,4-diene-1,7-dioate isomerase